MMPEHGQEDRLRAVLAELSAYSLAPAEETLVQAAFLTTERQLLDQVAEQIKVQPSAWGIYDNLISREAVLTKIRGFEAR